MNIDFPSVDNDVRQKCIVKLCLVRVDILEEGRIKLMGGNVGI